MERIVEIKDYEAREDFHNVAGFEVLTTEQSIKLFIDSENDCCERWGYFWCNDDLKDFIGAELCGVTLTDAALNEAQMKVNGLNPSVSCFEGRVMFVNLETDKGALQFVAYNEHNGYYGHEAKVQCAQLTHAEIL